MAKMNKETSQKMVENKKVRTPDFFVADKNNMREEPKMSKSRHKAINPHRQALGIPTRSAKQMQTGLY